MAPRPKGKPTRRSTNLGIVPAKPALLFLLDRVGGGADGGRDGIRPARAHGGVLADRKSRVGAAVIPSASRHLPFVPRVRLLKAVSVGMVAVGHPMDDGLRKLRTGRHRADG